MNKYKVLFLAVSMMLFGSLSHAQFDKNIVFLPKDNDGLRFLVYTEGKLFVCSKNTVVYDQIVKGDLGTFSSDRCSSILSLEYPEDMDLFVESAYKTTDDDLILLGIAVASFGGTYAVLTKYVNPWLKSRFDSFYKIYPQKSKVAEVASIITMFIAGTTTSYSVPDHEKATLAEKRKFKMYTRLTAAGSLMRGSSAVLGLGGLIWGGIELFDMLSDDATIEDFQDSFYADMDAKVTVVKNVNVETLIDIASDVADAQ